MVMVDSGFAAAGPGLPKRINAAVWSQRISSSSAARSDDVPIPHQSWFWASVCSDWQWDRRLCFSDRRSLVRGVHQSATPAAGLRRIGRIVAGDAAFPAMDV